MESDSIWFKIHRAIEHFETLKQAIAGDISSYGDKVTRNFEGKETLWLLEPSPLIALYAGEFIYQLRSTLDHIAFNLVDVNANKISLPADWEDACQFPIWTELKAGQTPPLPYGTFKKLPGIPIQAHTLIERAQPYYPAGIGSLNTHLRLLNILSNIEKHRRFAVTVVRAKVRHSILYRSGIRSESLNTLEHGAEIPTPYAGKDDPIVDVQTSTSLTIAFDERKALGDASGVPIDNLLQDIFNDVWPNLIDPLRKFLN